MNAADKEERQACHRAIRNRIALIATERGLAKSEISKAMGRLGHYDLYCFSQRTQRGHRLADHWPAPRLAQDSPRKATDAMKRRRPDLHTAEEPALISTQRRLFHFGGIGPLAPMRNRIGPGWWS
jgi:hypothetical protein